MGPGPGYLAMVAVTAMISVVPTNAQTFVFWAFRFNHGSKDKFTISYMTENTYLNQITNDLYLSVHV